MQPFAVFAFAAILVSLCAVFLFLVKGFLSGDRGGRSLPQPILLTVSAIILVGVFVGSLVLGREVLFTDNVAVQSAANESEAVAVSSQSPAELSELAHEVEQAAENIDGGLERTKVIIGKTAARNQAIEQGRDRASGKLNELAEQVRAAANGEKTLTDVEQQAAARVTEGL